MLISFPSENNDEIAFKVFNEEELNKNQEINSVKNPNESNEKQNEIKEPHNIKSSLIDEIKD